MTDLELLKELIAFEQYGTLSATAEHLSLALLRDEKIEHELDVSLFNREVN